MKLQPTMNRAAYAALSSLAVAAALLGPVTDAAVAAPRPTVAAPTATPDAPRPALTAHASVDSVRASQQFRIEGTSEGLPAGTPVTLQQKQGERWVDLPATVHTTARGTYGLRVVLDLVGRNELRMTGGGAVSPVMHVTVLPQERTLLEGRPVQVPPGQ
ncbi:hypothetical protein [Streptomyces silaceus]|uniref:hypothetical protein n=1 Tax=Streptomyces silaceus TaxID=545123 RepID=UPI000AD302ED|nr:hypothetical protein [Streptomyces silaceus]